MRMFIFSFFDVFHWYLTRGRVCEAPVGEMLCAGKWPTDRCVCVCEWENLRIWDLAAASPQHQQTWHTALCSHHHPAITFPRHTVHTHKQCMWHFQLINILSLFWLLREFQICISDYVNNNKYENWMTWKSAKVFAENPREVQWLVIFYKSKYDLLAAKIKILRTIFF